MEVLIAVGLLRYGLHHQLAEVQTRFSRRGIHLSLAELSNLSDEFLVRWSHWFDATRPRWSPDLEDFILMIDGTQDAGGRVTYRARDATTGLTLHAATLEAESTSEVTRFLEQVKAAFGTPRAIVRDLSSAARAACTAVFPGVPQQACHVHFLRDAGESLLGNAHEALRAAMLATKQLAALARVASALAQPAADSGNPLRRSVRVWTRLLLEDIQSARDATSGFPLRLAYHEVAVRIRDGRRLVAAVVAHAVRANVCDPLLLDAKERLDALGGDERVRTAFVHLDRLQSWFGEVRTLLRLERATLRRGLRPQAVTAADRAAILARVHTIRGEAAQAGDHEASAWQRVVDRFEAHAGELWVALDVKGLPRTTNAIEGDHRETRRSIRRRTGRHETRREMERTGEHLARWSNANNPWFIQHALAGVDLVAAFRTQDPRRIRAGVDELRAKRWRDRLPVRPADRRERLEEFVRLLDGPFTVERLTAWADRVEGVTSPAV